MDQLKILLTGHYWHTDFKDLISSTRHLLTLKKLDHQACVDIDPADYDLVIIAQSRPAQFEQDLLERFVDAFVNIPVISLCGSWCEGEPRSGTVVPGAIRLYWHQWLGEFENFLDCLSRLQTSHWHLPKIATDADRLLMQAEPEAAICAGTIGVSSLTADGFYLFNDSIREMDFRWIEKSRGQDVDDHSFCAVCIEANSLTNATQNRIQLLKRRCPSAELILFLNFPRPNEISKATAMGVGQVFSKPFQLKAVKRRLRQSQLQSVA